MLYSLNKFYIFYSSFIFKFYIFIQVLYSNFIFYIILLFSLLQQFFHYNFGVQKKDEAKNAPTKEILDLVC